MRAKETSVAVMLATEFVGRKEGSESEAKGEGKEGEGQRREYYGYENTAPVDVQGRFTTRTTNCQRVQKGVGVWTGIVRATDRPLLTSLDHECCRQARDRRGVSTRGNGKDHAIEAQHEHWLEQPFRRPTLCRRVKEPMIHLIHFHGCISPTLFRAAPVGVSGRK